MLRNLVEWMKWKWGTSDSSLLQSYNATFNSLHGQRVLNHLLDNIYCTVYEGSNPNECLMHNARRSVVQEILETLDHAEHPRKYDTSVVTEIENNGTR
mgnify:CR=1 FL=1